MNHNSSKQEDVLQLQQLVRHLQSELNRYKTSRPYSKDEVDHEKDKLKIAHEELLYKSKKQQKRIDLYEKQLKNLMIQRDDAIDDANRLQEVQEMLNVENHQLTETLRLLKEDLVSEIRNTLNERKLADEEFTDKTPFLNAELTSCELLSKKEALLHNEKEEIRSINQLQKELIAILEEYVKQLTENNSPS